MISTNINSTISNAINYFRHFREHCHHRRQQRVKVQKNEDKKIPLPQEKIIVNEVVVEPKKRKYLWIKNPSYNPGMFCIFSMVAGILHHCEKNKNDFEAVAVDFGDKGLYYDANRGPNWWEYYCEPIKVENSADWERIEYTDQQYAQFDRIPETQMTRQQVNSIINKHIKIRPEIVKQVDDFANKEFKDFHVIGIHYRGTDKVKGGWVEAPVVEYEKVASVIKEQIQNLPDTYKIFVATDEQGFLDYLKKEFPGKIIETPAYRSTDGQAIHLKNSNPAKQGEEAMIDALLLARTMLLIRTSSNLSLWSTFFNSEIPVIELSQRLKDK